MAYLFKAEGELYPDSPWDFGAITQTHGTFARAAGAAQNGGYGFEVVYNGLGWTNFGEKSPAGMGDSHWGRMFFKIPSGFGIPGNNHFYVLTPCRDGGLSPVMVELKYSTAVNKWSRKFKIRDMVTITTIWDDSANFVLDWDTWYRVETRYYTHLTLGGGEIWWEGAKMAENYTRDTSGYVIDKCVMGALGGNNPPDGFKIHYDDWWFSDSGPIGDEVSEYSTIRSVKKAANEASRIILARR